MCVLAVSAALVVLGSRVSGQRGSADHAGRVRRRPARLQRQATHQSLRVAKDSQNIIQAKSFLHKSQTRRGTLSAEHL